MFSCLSFWEWAFLVVTLIASMGIAFIGGMFFLIVYE